MWFFVCHRTRPLGCIINQDQKRERQNTITDMPCQWCRPTCTWLEEEGGIHNSVPHESARAIHDMMFPFFHGEARPSCFAQRGCDSTWWGLTVTWGKATATAARKVCDRWRTTIDRAVQKERRWAYTSWCSEVRSRREEHAPIFIVDFLPKVGDASRISAPGQLPSEENFLYRSTAKENLSNRVALGRGAQASHCMRAQPWPRIVVLAKFSVWSSIAIFAFFSDAEKTKMLCHDHCSFSHWTNKRIKF